MENVYMRVLKKANVELSGPNWACLGVPFVASATRFDGLDCVIVKELKTFFKIKGLK